MDDTILDPEENIDINTAVPEACRIICENLRPQIVKLSGIFDESTKTVKLEGKCLDNEQASSMLLRIFFEFWIYIPAVTKGIRYILDFNTFIDPSFKNLKHAYHIETSMDFMPDTGEVTRSQWEKLTSQLIYTKDGTAQAIPAPEPFIDEPPAPSNKSGQSKVL